MASGAKQSANLLCRHTGSQVAEISSPKSLKPRDIHALPYNAYKVSGLLSTFGSAYADWE